METKDKETRLGEKIKRVLINYFITQFILVLIIFSVTWGILALLNIKYALILSVLTGALSIVPYFGMFIASIAVALVAIFDKSVFLPNLTPFFEGVVVFIILFIINKFVDIFLAPLFLGKTNKINPVLLIIAVFLGTVFFGVAGAILTLPTILVIKTLLDHYNIKISNKK